LTLFLFPHVFPTRPSFPASKSPSTSISPPISNRIGNIEGCFRFASPANRAATGPVDRFTRLLLSPTYRPLVRCRAAEILRAEQVAPHHVLVIVGCTSGGEELEEGQGPSTAEKVVYSWVVGLQGKDAGAEAGCWLTEGVNRVSMDGGLVGWDQIFGSE
jgi:hypothetical protein